MRTSLLSLLALSLAVFTGSTSATKPPLVSQARVDLQRYMGRWWVIAHTPYFAERGKVATADEYTLRPDGTIDNVYVYRKAFDKPEKRTSGVAKVVPGTNNAQWRIGFFGGLIKADYLILEVAPDYSWALIGQPSRKLAWIFARDPKMGDARMMELAKKFSAYGYDPGKLVRVPQNAEQLTSGN